MRQRQAQLASIPLGDPNRFALPFPVIRLMPWLAIDSTHLWVTKGNTLFKLNRYTHGRIASTNNFALALRHHKEDICRFVLKKDLAITSSLDGTISGWDKVSGDLVFSKRKAHQ